MEQFDPQIARHIVIVCDAIEKADTHGLGRISTAREALEDNGISTKKNEDTFQTCVFQWGQLGYGYSLEKNQK